MKTYSVKKADTLNKKWYLVDAEDEILGRLASKIAVILRGKNKPKYSPHMDMGDYVVVINAEKISFTGKKLRQKKYHKHTGYIGNLKETSLEEMLERHPERVVYNAVKGMMPKNILGRKMMKKLKVYAGDEHPHQAQQPEKIEL